MIDHSLAALLFIRACVILLQYAPLIEVSLFLPCLFLMFNPTNPIAQIISYRTLQITTYTFASLLIVEAIYYFTYYRPHKRRLQQWADYPAPLSLSERRHLFERCVANVSDWNNYLRLWFMLEKNENYASHRPNQVDEDIVSQIKQDNIREFMLWAFFDREEYSDGRSHDDEEVQLQEFISIVEHLLGHKFPPGRGKATALRLTIDKVRVRYRCAVWYGLIAIVDFATYLILRSHNFTHFNPSPSTTTTKENPTPATAPIFPPRMQSLLQLPFPGAQYFRNKQSSPSSPGSVIGYWSRPHRSKTHHPILFIHGIGIGLWPYKTFLAQINKDTDPSRQIGIIALEIMPMSARLTAPPLTQSVFLEQVTAILAAQGDGDDDTNPWSSFVLVSHSYGSVLSTHVLHSPALGPRVHGLVLIDPVSILLHLPDVAFNFTRRVPRTASEWQLWYFASTDMGIAEGLGRHFFWRENIIWKEELVTREVLKEEGSNGVVNRNRGKNGNAKGKRKVAVSLSGRDLIVDTRSVARYLESDKDLKELAEDGSAVDAIFGDRDCTRTSRLDPSLEILWFGQLDHAQVFDTSRDTGRIVDAVRRFCLKDATE